MRVLLQKIAATSGFAPFHCHGDLVIPFATELVKRGFMTADVMEIAGLIYGAEPAAALVGKRLHPFNSGDSRLPVPATTRTAAGVHRVSPLHDAHQIAAVENPQMQIGIVHYALAVVEMAVHQAGQPYGDCGNVQIVTPKPDSFASVDDRRRLSAGA